MTTASVMTSRWKLASSNHYSINHQERYSAIEGFNIINNTTTGLCREIRTSTVFRCKGHSYNIKINNDEDSVDRSDNNYGL